MVCPYFHEGDGICSVWDYRTAQCSAYFCKFNNGQDGWRFWDALREYLHFVERILAAHSLDQLGWGAENILSIEAELPILEAGDLDELPPDAEAWDGMWGEWAGREEELYRGAYEVVRRMDSETFRRISGIEHSLLSKRLLGRYTRMLSPRVPDVLIRNPHLVVYPVGDGSVLVGGSIPSDPRKIRREIYTLLDLFDSSRPWRDVVASIEDAAGRRLTESLVTMLYQHRVLVDAGPRVTTSCGRTDPRAG
jgi:hypothetical protein